MRLHMCQTGLFTVYKYEHVSTACGDFLSFFPNHIIHQCDSQAARQTQCDLKPYNTWLEQVPPLDTVSSVSNKTIIIIFYPFLTSCVKVT